MAGVPGAAGHSRALRLTDVLIRNFISLLEGCFGSETQEQWILSDWLVHRGNSRAHFSIILTRTRSLSQSGRALFAFKLMR